MILKGSQRSGARQLAAHLLKTEENEHVEVHEIRGFVSEDLRSALQEAYAVSQGTRCKQFLFSLSLNPPENATVPIEVFEAAIEQAEQRLGLSGQPRAIVFHEKEGRRHAHAVWSRIDTEHMRAVPMTFFKTKLCAMAKELYLEQGWRLPEGFIDKSLRDPTTFTREQWQQAKRAGHDPRALKTLFRDCWAASDSRAAFAKALEERGFHLARGDRRGHVAIDFRGEIYAVSKYAGVTAKEVRARLGDPATLPSVVETRSGIAMRMTSVLKTYIAEADAAFGKQSASLTFRRNDMVQRHRAARETLRSVQEQRWTRESQNRAGRLNKGFRGLWDRLTGAHARAQRQNEYDTLLAYQRDQAERNEMIEGQLGERRELQHSIRDIRQHHGAEMLRLHRDVGAYMRLDTDRQASPQGEPANSLEPADRFGGPEL